MALELRRLRREDDRSDFHSGNVELDRFLARYAAQNQFRHHIGTTYVAVEAGRIHGYLTLAAAEVEISGLLKKQTKGLRSYPLPALRIARLAVDDRLQGRGIGRSLLKLGFEIAHELAAKVGCVGVVVDAKQEAVGFYSSYGFEPFELLQGELGARPVPVSMFLSLGSIPR